MALLIIAEQFAKFDSIRGFDCLGSAIKIVNQLKADEVPPPSVLSKPRLLTIKSYTVINGREMTTSENATAESIDFSQIAPLVAQDYMQARLLGNNLEKTLWRAKFLTAVAVVILAPQQGSGSRAAN